MKYKAAEFVYKDDVVRFINGNIDVVSICHNGYVYVVFYRIRKKD